MRPLAITFLFGINFSGAKSRISGSIQKYFRKQFGKMLLENSLKKMLCIVL